MSKAILVMDMPSNCKKCRYSVVYARKNKLIWKCCLNIPSFIENEDINKRQEWCPLREVPQKKDGIGWVLESEQKYIEGYNQCIDEILGGAE